MDSIYELEKNKPILFWVSLLLVLELFSVLAWFYSSLSMAFLLLLALIVICAYRKNKQLLILIPLLELSWGSLGRSLQYDFFSLRWLIFLVTLIFFLVLQAKNLRNLKIVKNKVLGRFFIVYFLLIILFIVIAFINQHSVRNIFLDANAYFYFLYLPIWLEYYDESVLKNILKILLASALVIAVKTLITFYLFTQSFFALGSYYEWIRDTRVGEITRLDNGFVRIFFQSQLYLLVAWTIFFDKVIKSKLTVKYFIYLLLFSSALYISLSRSLWLGSLLALFILLVLNKNKLKSLRYLLFLGIASYTLVILLFNFPKFHQINLFNNRSVDIQEAAVATRTILLPIMLENIWQQPILGYGFGKELSFFSQDPRSKNALNPTGQRTSFSFEWGWLDFMLKGGLLLTLFFVYSLFYIIRGTYAIIKAMPHFTAYIAIFSALALIHVFTPYLNHPLGLALLVLGLINTKYYV